MLSDSTACLQSYPYFHDSVRYSLITCVCVPDGSYAAQLTRGSGRQTHLKVISQPHAVVVSTTLLADPKDDACTDAHTLTSVTHVLCNWSGLWLSETSGLCDGL